VSKIKSKSSVSKASAAAKIMVGRFIWRAGYGQGEVNDQLFAEMAVKVLKWALHEAKASRSADQLLKAWLMAVEDLEHLEVTQEIYRKTDCHWGEEILLAVASAVLREEAA
jgi:hypothetical protein